MTSIAKTVAAGAVVLALGTAGFGSVAGASSAPRPVVTGMSTHSAAYWGGSTISVYGRNLAGAGAVSFGGTQAWSTRVVNSGRIDVTTPWHDYGTVTVKVTTPGGTSAKAKAASFRFVHPGFNTPIQGGMTAHQLQAVARSVMSKHHNVATVSRSTRWTAAMGANAVRRAESWIGMPYSWVGGNSAGPTYGQCAHNGGDLDCHIKGFDCSGLTLYSWAPYKAIAHYTGTQIRTAGKFHPTRAQLVPGDLVFFSGGGHVGIYAGNGQVIESPESGYTVRRSALADMVRWDGYSGAVRPLSTGRQGKVPYLASLGARVPLGGGLVTLHGKYLSGALGVSVGGVVVQPVGTRTDSTLTVKVPAHAAGVVALSVSTAWGTTQNRAVNYTPGPRVTALGPSSGSTLGGESVQLTGTNLAYVNAVTVDGAGAAFTRSSTGAVTVTMPAHAAGPVAVVATSPFGSSSPQRFTYLQQDPQPSRTAVRR